LYNIPFRNISLYDLAEKKSPLQPGGMNRGLNIFDHLYLEQIPYHVSSPAASEQENFAALKADISAERIDFAFLYWPGLDALLHQVGNQSAEVPRKLREYERWLEDLLEFASAHYTEVRLYVFSDHGMANCDEQIDLMSRVEKLPLKVGEDYAVVYDSTMARFWFLKPGVRDQIASCLQGVPEGRILADAELDELGALFPDRYFGELIFLVREGVLIVPSHMGARPIRAMHGYHPADKHSYAALCTNMREVDQAVQAIPDMFNLMRSEAQFAHGLNRASIRSATAIPHTG